LKININEEISTDVHNQGKAKLIWQEDSNRREIAVTNTGLTIGRSKENDLALPDLRVSRFHCKIMPEEDGFVVVDVGSSNGTIVNGSKIKECLLLKSKDILLIGSFQYEFFISPHRLTKRPARSPADSLALERTYVVPPAEKSHSLFVSSGIGKGTQFPLSKGKMKIGRANRNQQWDIDLVDRSISRPHAVLEQRGTKWVISDSGSANGTTVNGVRIKDPVELLDGDALGFGETILIYRET
jgi:pSer/pThr/pTyr-binding forkhead associated (FHA) protein